MERIVLAYSGGLGTSVAIPWLMERYNAEVITLSLDLGQGRELTAIEHRAKEAGAVQAHVLDVRDEFARFYVLPALQAGAVYEDHYPLATALGRPLIARKLVEIAHAEGATAVAHGCTGKGNDQVRFDISVRALDPAIRVIAPAREWGLTRLEEIAYANERGIPVPVTTGKPYSVDANLWGRSVECGVLEDPWMEPPEDVFALTRAGNNCPDIPAYLEVTFAEGVPIEVNGIDMPLVDLIASVSTIAGAHGVGRIDMIENRLVGIKSREVYEAPAAVVLHAAHRELEGIVIPRDLRRLKSELATKYADMVYDGLWFSPTREAIDALVAKVQVRIRLFKGNHRIVGRQSPYALFDYALATYDEGDRFDHSAAVGFIKIWGLPIETAARLAQRRVRGSRREARVHQVASTGSFQSAPGFRGLTSDGS
jgi:argininosuccinate synthase